MQRTLVGLVRDLRGIAFAFNAKTSFMMLFEWMYPSIALKFESSYPSEAGELWLTASKCPIFPAEPSLGSLFTCVVLSILSLSPKIGLSVTKST